MTTTRYFERARFSFEALWEDDVQALTVAVYMQAPSGGTIYRSELVAGVDAGQVTVIPVDLAAVFDAAGDPATAISLALPVGTYNVEIVAGKYEGAALPHATMDRQIEVVEAFSY